MIEAKSEVPIHFTNIETGPDRVSINVVTDNGPVYFEGSVNDLRWWTKHGIGRNLYDAND